VAVQPIGKYHGKHPGSSRCKTGARTDVRNEIFAIVFGKLIIENERHTEKQVV